MYRRAEHRPGKELRSELSPKTESSANCGSVKYNQGSVTKIGTPQRQRDFARCLSILYYLLVQRGNSQIACTTTIICVQFHFAPYMWEKTRCDGKRKLRHDAYPIFFHDNREESMSNEQRALQDISNARSPCFNTVDQNGSDDNYCISSDSEVRAT